MHKTSEEQLVSYGKPYYGIRALIFSVNGHTSFINYVVDADGNIIVPLAMRKLES